MKIIDVSKSYGDKTIFDKFNFAVEKNKITAIMGRSGIGKTTLLKIIAGLTDYEGKVETDGEISYVFGEASLISSLTVKQNLDYAVSHVIKDKTERTNAILGVLNELELERELNSYPHKLSTGMAQRVALARGFLYPSDALIMDEPFRGLDTALKSRLQKFFLELLAKNDKTVLLITHDVNEALLLADRIVVFEGNPIEITFDEEIHLPKEKRSLSCSEIASIGDNLLKVLQNAN